MRLFLKPTAIPICQANVKVAETAVVQIYWQFKTYH